MFAWQSSFARVASSRMRCASVAARGAPRASRAVVVEELARQIISGAFAAGDVLPTEPALCEQFGFSRTVIREALKMLEERGLVRVEQGRGTTVQPRDVLEPPRSRRAPDRARVRRRHVAARRPDRRSAAMLEREMARGRGERLSDDELAALAENHRADGGGVRRLRALPRRTTRAFHAIVMQASGNEVGLTIVRVIHRHGGVTPPLAAARASTAALERDGAGHRAILEALAAGDGELAGDRISSHIESRVGRAEARSQHDRDLTSGDHSYDDHPRCGSPRSTST